MKRVKGCSFCRHRIRLSRQVVFHVFRGSLLLNTGCWFFRARIRQPEFAAPSAADGLAQFYCKTDFEGIIVRCTHRSALPVDPEQNHPIARPAFGRNFLPVRA